MPENVDSASGHPLRVTALAALRTGDRIEALLAVREKRGIAPYRGGHVQTLVLGDRTGSLAGKVWLAGAGEAQKGQRGDREQAPGAA